MRPEQERVKKLLTEAVTLLCRNSLQFDDEVTVEGLIGITLDKRDIFLVSIRETVEQTFKEAVKRSQAEHDTSDVQPESPSAAKRRRMRERHKEEDHGLSPSPSPKQRKERHFSNKSPDLGDVHDMEDDSRPDGLADVQVKTERRESSVSDRLQGGDVADFEDSIDQHRAAWDVAYDGRLVHPAHDSSQTADSSLHRSDHDRGRTSPDIKPSAKLALDEPSTSSGTKPDSQPSSAPRIKEELNDEENADECFVIDSEEDSMTDSRSNPLPVSLGDAQLGTAAGWTGGDGSGNFGGFQDPDMIAAAQQFPNLTQMGMISGSGSFMSQSQTDMPSPGGSHQFPSTSQDGSTSQQTASLVKISTFSNIFDASSADPSGNVSDGNSARSGNISHYQQMLKKMTPVRMQQFRENEKKRVKAFREKNDWRMTEEQKERRRAASRLRSKRFRDRKKEEKAAQQPKSGSK